MHNFPLFWRFNDPNYDVLAASVLDGILPLDQSNSLEIWHNQISVFDHISQANFTNFISAFDIDTVNPEAGKKILVENISIPDNESIISFWSPTCSVVTDWLTVTDNWTSFFYPSDDNIVILSRSVLVTFAEERICTYGAQTTVNEIGKAG